ncbi:MAG TPA: CHRD domain-containing protein [Steroidobacteraceae bacterium]|nr:CHRD domain-containing protein [Steroidobacteraceae bacterium]
MFRTRRALIPLAVAVALACFAVGARAGTVFTASMDGAQNQPEPLKTDATGTVELKVSADGKSVEYKVSVNKLLNAAAADIHLGPPIQNGPLVVKLWPHDSGAAKKGEFSGVLAEGRFDAGDLIGPMTGAPLADLIEELAAGNAYVNVHTNDGMDPPNSGPGDYRLGEIRGQLK